MHFGAHLLIFSFFLIFPQYISQKTEKKPLIPAATIPEEIEILMKHYPQILKYEDNKIYFSESDFVIFDDGKEKTFQELLDNPDVKDQFLFDYKAGKMEENPSKNFDPGRIRNEEFFKKIYGETKADVQKNLVQISWCPKLINQKIMVTTVNGIDQKLLAISAELDELPEFKEYITNIGGTFNWRVIRGTTRLSFHSFGATIDINTKFSNYWQWDCGCKNEDAELGYKNRIPQEIIDVFEKHGFIWGGKWYHYDTMHFEYRPELVFGKS